ncbi:MAG: hypothetical protein HYZ14_16010 [Bacteroidetes bacterium]|nr:hypothetical protein [Bacteroidota bacterium]
MTFLKENKYHFAGLLLVVFLFVISVLVRKENQTVPLSRHHEWITAHTLITCEIWAKNGGPSAYHFSPVYTYPGEGNHRRRMLGGVVDETGNVYYVSYPPFSFLFAYYATQLLGGPDTDSIRNLNLVIHLVCSLLLYLIALSLSPESRKRDFSVAGITASFLYLFSTGNLWMHGNLYFADMLVQLFIIAGLYASIRFFRRQYKRQALILSALAAVFFLATYTEWLGLFLAFFTGLAFLTAYFIKKERRYIYAFLAVGGSSALALALTFMQYSSIAGWSQLKEVSTSKYEERSGREAAAETPNEFTLDNEQAYEFMIDRIDGFYKMAENFVGIFAILFLLVAVIPNLRRRIQHAGVAFLITGLLLISILTHYFLFFNFNSLHDFSSLKTGFLFILVVLVFGVLTESVLNLKLRAVLFLLVAYLAVDKGLESVARYEETFPLAETDWDRMNTGAAMKKFGTPDEAVFMNISSNPELVYAAGHNVFPVKDTSGLEVLMKFYGNQRGQYYHHLGTKLEYILTFEMQQNQLIYLNRINLNSVEGSSGRVYQK